MNEPSSSEPEDFQQELEALRALLKQNLKNLKEDPLLGTQVDFWLESARFMETNIKIWEDAGNTHQRRQALERMRKVLDALKQLVEQMNNGTGTE